MHSIHCRSFLPLACLACLTFFGNVAQAIEAGNGGVRCVEPVEETSERFSGLQHLAGNLNKQVCLALLTNDPDDFEATQQGLYRDFALKAIETATEQLANSNIADWRVPFNDWLGRVSTSKFRDKDVPELSIVTRPLDGSTVFLFNDTKQAGTIPDPSDASCGPRHNERCIDVLQDMAVAINVYNDSYADFTLKTTERRLGELSNEWENFLRQGRSQTLLDLIATTFIERSHFEKDYIVGPPERQWAFMHPSLVYEHAPEATSGDRDKLAVAVEWIGVNWWSDRSPFFGVPFGISIASVYSDRPGMESVGHGAMLHIANKYSIGWASRGGESSYYLTIDLLRFIEDSEQRFDRYKEVMIGGD